MDRTGVFLMRAQLTWWRFIPAAALVLVAGALASLHRVPVHLGAPPAMQRAGFVRRLASQFSRDTGFPVTIDTVPATKVDERVRRGDLDIVITHGPGAAGALDTATQMRADLSATFVIVGPPSDPAHVGSAWSASDALAKIAATRAPYQPSPTASVASDVEAAIWRTADSWSPRDVPPSTVQAALAMADGRGAYMIIDRPTFRRLSRRTHLTVLFEGDPALLDVYMVAELRHAATHTRCGKAFWTWFHSPEGKAAVRTAAFEGERDYFLVH
jgi:tungstate transport system substrate-binding protein